MLAKLVGFLAITILIIGCGSEPENARTSGETADAGNSDPQLSESQTYLLEELPPDFQLWSDGATFSDSTRMMVLQIRSVALDAMVERARASFSPDLSGMVNVRMVIEPDGSISLVSLLDDEWSDPRAASLTDSVLYAIELWTFPPGLERPLSLEQPFKFHP
jgi:hypothetical protein